MKPSSIFKRFVPGGNNRGSAFVQALVVIGVAAIALYFLSPVVLKQRQQVTKTASIITARLALHSMTDFTLLGIKQRWCFSTDWLPEPCGVGNPPTMVQILNHPRSVERLLMKSETVEFLRSMGIANPESIPLKKISQVISVKSFSALHPVYKIVSELKGYKVESIDVTIERDMRGVVPEYGRELYLKVKVSLLGADGKVIQVGSSVLTSTSYVGVYPREVGSFALMVAGDLRLDLSSSTDLKTGDSYIKNFSSRKERLQYPGLVFDGPVFVNGSVVLPEAPDLVVDKSEIDTIYTPVRFNEKVVLGEGPVKRKGLDGIIREFKPRASGDLNDQFWSDIRQMGGFQKGVEIDGDRDLGLDYLSGAATGTMTDANLMEACIANNLAKYDLSKTTNSDLRGQLLNNVDNNFHYRLGFTYRDRFNPQLGQVSSPQVMQVGSSGETLKSWSLSRKDGAVSKFSISIGRLRVVGEIPDNGSITLRPEINLKDLKSSIDKQLSDAEKRLSYEQSKLKDQNTQLSSANSNLSQLQSDLQAAIAKNDTSAISSLQNQISQTETQISSLEKQITTQTQTVTDAQTKVTTLVDQQQNIDTLASTQPSISISITPPLNADGSLPSDFNPTFRDISVKFDHPEALLASNGDPLNVSLQLEGYDVSYYKGYSLRNWSNTDLNKGWLFFNRNGVGFNPSAYLSDSSGKSKGALPTDNPFIDYDVLCAKQSSSAFAGTDWGKSFAPSSKLSWSFTNKYEERTNFEFNADNAYKASGGGGTATFTVKSIAKDCIIKSSANFVAAFMNCERLIVEPRNTPLRIVGSFIVSNGVYIAPEAYDAGIRWSTIYQPMATYELRQVGILKGINNQSCSSLNRYPVWHPYPSMTDVANLYKCNAISLRSKADPFRWTTVDPDCGLLTGGTSTVCKNRLVRFYVLEVSRESGI